MQVFKQAREAARDVAETGNFSGEVRMQRVIDPEHSPDLELLVVHFEAGARTRPHVHPVDQVLHIIEGRGIVATSDEVQYVQAGDIVLAPAGEWHWHGATPDSPMTHISIKHHGETDWGVEERDWASKYGAAG